MKMYSLLFLVIILLTACERPQHKNLLAKSPNATVTVEVFRISDINFPDQQYSIDFWLSIDYKDSVLGSRKIDFANQLRIPNSKGIPRIKLIDSSPRNTIGIKNEELEINCTMAADWDVAGFPFDDQELAIEIYNPVFDTSQLNFNTSSKRIHFRDLSKFESGWRIDTTNTTMGVKIEPLFDDPVNDSHSVFYFQIPIHRNNPGLIFIKLCIGMYVAFMVAFVAYYINLDHDEPRFGLPVGGLFAAIANKYVIESQLPLTPEYSLVDWLHHITIFAIFLIIAFSTISMKLKDKKDKLDRDTSDTEVSPRAMHWMKRIDRIKPKMFLAIYFGINALIILVAVFHESLGFE